VSSAPWWKQAVIYQIYPRSFADASGDGIGDIPGIITKLDYLNDGTEASLGVDAIWLSPFYPSPMADFGYDISDYTDVHPLFGTLADFDRLLREAHARQIKVIVDWVPNHTSDRHPWFLESRSARDTDKRDWYVWRDSAPDGGPPNNWKSAFPAVGRAWTFDEATSQWYLHSFMAEQPDLNWDNPEVQEAMFDTLRFWLSRGVDGFRIDVAHKIGKDPELGDNPPDIDESTAFGAARRHDEDWPSTHDRMRLIRKVLEEYDDAMAVGEVYILDQERLVRYVNTGDELHLAHNFVFVHQPWEVRSFREVISEWFELATEQAWPAWFLNNHDSSRVATRFGEDDRGAARARLAGMLTLTLRGTPFVYQGEELGLPDVPVPPERTVDVDGRDPQRAPFPWEAPSEAGPGAGFSNAEPWLPVTPDAEQVNARRQSDDEGSTLSFYRRLIRLRRDNRALSLGDFELIDVPDEVLAYVREGDGRRFLVALNFAGAPIVFDAAGSTRANAGRVMLSTDSARGAERLTLGAVELHADEGLLVELL
jgi:alpha-glucosidase